MVSDHILKIVIEAEDRATEALERLESLMKRLGLISTESFDKARGGSTKFTDSLLKSNSPLGQIQKHLKTVGVTGVQSFNQLSVSERKTLLEMSSLSKEARDVMQRLNEIGTIGPNTWNQLSQSQQKALTSMNSLSQSTRKESQELEKLMATIPNVAAQMDSINKNMLWPELFKTLPKVGAELRTMGAEFSAVSSSSKEKMGLIGSTITSVREKLVNLGGTAKEALGSRFSGAVTSAKEKLSSLKGSISSASTSMKTLNQSTQSAGSGMGFLRSAASMTVGMIGYDLVNSIMEAGRASINAAGNFGAFGKRMRMSASEIKKFSEECNTMQSQFRKVDMNAVGASALELGVKLGVPKSQMGALTKMTAVMSSAFIKEGRTQEDAILAVSDAMDGQFRRLQEIGITQDKLKQNGWNGNLQDTASLMNAINTTMDQMGITKTAQGIYTLDDAYQALTVSGGQFLAKVLIPITPLITGAVDGITGFLGVLESLGSTLSGMPDAAKITLLVTGITVGLVMLSAVIMSTVIPSLISSGIALITWIIEAMGGTLATDSLAFAFQALGFVIWEALAPFLPLIAAIALAAVAFYELGKAFDWWHDLDSMFAAFTAGWNRICSAVSENEALQEAFDILKYAIYAVQQALSPLIGSLQGCGGEFNIVGWIIHGVVIPAIEVLSVIIRYVAYAIIWTVSACQQLYSAFEYIGGCISNTIAFFEWLYNCIVNIPTAAQDMIAGIITWFSQLPGLVWGWIVSTATNIVGGMTAWINYGRAKAQVFINAVIGFIKTLPGRVYTYIVNTASRILSGAASWVTNARNRASATVNAVVNRIAGLPGAVYQEFLNIGNRIVQAGQSVLNKAKQFGANLKNAVLNALGIHSPGIIQEKIATEFANIAGRITDKAKNAYNSAKDYGSKILDGFRSNDMGELDVNPSMNMVEGIPSPNVSATATLDTSNVTGGMNDTNNIISSGFNNMFTNEQTSMNNLVSDVNTNFGLIKLQEQSSMDTMTSHINESMNNIVSKTKSGLLETTNTTQFNLTKMQNSTSKVTGAMVKSWDSMKNSIVKAAKNIKTESSNYFGGLQKTISSFYNKLQHPGGAGPRPAGGGTNTKPSTRRAGSIFNKINSKLASKTFGVDIEYLGSNTTASNTRGVSLTDIMKSITDGKGAGGWNSIVTPNVSKIKNTARNWSMKGPKVWNKYTTGLSFKVKEFENSVPKINFATFKGLAEDVFSQCSYLFYYDSEKYGNWQTAFTHGRMNCSDSSDALIWLAHQCGLPATKVHGHWNQFGHYWANIAGHKMDTTGWMNQRNWTPSASHAGPAPLSPFKDLEESIDNLATDTTTGETFDVITGETVSTEITVNGELKVIHEFKNLPKGVSAKEVAEIVNETTSSEDWQKKLANSVAFQSEDDKVKTRLKRKLTRAKGVR